MFALLLYGIPVVVILVTLWTGWLGLRFSLDEVVRGGSDARADLAELVESMERLHVDLFHDREVRRGAAPLRRVDRPTYRHRRPPGGHTWVGKSRRPPSPARTASDTGTRSVAASTSSP